MDPTGVDMRKNAFVWTLLQVLYRPYEVPADRGLIFPHRRRLVKRLSEPNRDGFGIVEH